MQPISKTVTVQGCLVLVGLAMCTLVINRPIPQHQCFPLFSYHLSSSESARHCYCVPLYSRVFRSHQLQFDCSFQLQRLLCPHLYPNEFFTKPRLVALRCSPPIHHQSIINSGFQWKGILWLSHPLPSIVPDVLFIESTPPPPAMHPSKSIIPVSSLRHPQFPFYSFLDVNPYFHLVVAIVESPRIGNPLA